MSLIATAMGLFVLRNSTLLFDTGPWVHFVEFIGGNKLIPGWILLAGGLLGVIGLVTRRRAISVASCIVCLGWCGWISSFLWYANATGEPNLGSFFSIIAATVFILRFWLLVVVPEPGEEIGRGW